MRPLPPPEPPPTPIEVKPEPPKIDGAIAATPEPQPRKTPKPDYVFHVRFVHMRTSEERTETITLSDEQVAEAFIDGVGPTGNRGRELAIRIATDRVAHDLFIFKSASFDLVRLQQSLDRE